jgi:hypothetical protein
LDFDIGATGFEGPEIDFRIQLRERALLSENVDILRDLVEALIERGTLSGAEVDVIIWHRIAMQSIEIEHERRADWRQRELNKARFLEKNPLSREDCNNRRPDDQSVSSGLCGTFTVTV